MNDLTVFEHSGVYVIDSREVAEMVEKDHAKLMRDIRQYCEYLNEAKIGLVEFFIESSYLDNKGETRPCYLLTRKGCDMVANKMTGKKGVLFTAAYVNKFHDMEQNQSQPKSMEDIMIYQLQETKKLKEQHKQLETRVESIDQKFENVKDIIALNPHSWRKDSAGILNQSAKSMGGMEHIRGLRTEIYSALEDRFGVSLKIRLSNMRRRMADEGVCKSKRDKLNQLDVIAEDKKLIEGYIAIVKEVAVKNGVSTNKEMGGVAWEN